MWNRTNEYISIHKSSRKYLRFIIDGIIYEFRALPMGYTSSPRVFTRLTKFLTAFCRRHKVKLSGRHVNIAWCFTFNNMCCFQVIIIMYIDDILILGVSFEDCQAKTRFWIINWFVASVGRMLSGLYLTFWFALVSSSTRRKVTWSQVSQWNTLVSHGISTIGEWP